MFGSSKNLSVWPRKVQPCIPLQPGLHSPHAIPLDGKEMGMGEVRDFRPKPGDSEKITINLGHVDLGQIDLLVQEGFYSNRTDVIRTAIRNQLERHGDAIRRSRVTSWSLVCAISRWSSSSRRAPPAKGSTSRSWG
jgi:Arc/MetJ-type ribon-helix-helix transcriptional regulator